MSHAKLLLFDGHGLAYRAFYALPPLSTSKGIPVNAVLGMANMILKVLEKENASHAAFSFDAGMPISRISAFAHYKAHREQMPENLATQLESIKTLVKLMGFPIIELEGYEADDCIATMVHALKEEDVETIIVTGDMDLLQLVSEKTHVLVTLKGTSEVTIFTSQDVKKKFGVLPHQLADYKGLAGDTSDNIPGVAGIGPKTAASLVCRFGSIEEIYGHIDEVESEKVKKLLVQYKETAFLSKLLASLIFNAPICFSLNDCERADTYSEEFAAFLEKLEFKKLMDRLGLVRKNEVLQKNNFIISHAKDVQQEDLIKELTESTMPALAGPKDGITALAVSEEKIFIASIDELKDILSSLAYDCTLTCLTVHDSKKWLRQCPEFESYFSRLLRHDTVLAGFLLNPNTPSPSLKQLADIHLGEEFEFSNGIPGLAREAAALFKLAPALNDKLVKENLLQVYREIEILLPPVLARMESEGIALDCDYFRELAKEVERDLFGITDHIYKMAEEEFNIASSKQLAHVLYEKLKLPAGRKTKTGFSTDSEELERLAKHSDIAVEILAFRELSKLKNTYIDSLPSLVAPDTGRIHTSFHQAVTATGRLSSTNPNLQNIPIRSEFGKRIRKGFVAPSPNHIILALDYSQIELRILAHMSNDKTLLEIFHLQNGGQGDVHTQTSAEIFGVSPEDVTLDMRRTAKAVNFGIIYGMTEHGLSQTLGISMEKAREFIANYFKKFPGVKDFIQKTLEEARQKGYVTTIFGRKRYLPDISSRNRMVREAAERMAINTPVQGTAAEIIKLAMIRIYKEMKTQKLKSKMILQVHDELIFEVLQSELYLMGNLAVKEMEQAYPLNVPLKVNVELGPNWADTKPISLSML